jgi:hypothetical protein
MTAEALAAARQRGAAIVRLFTSQANTASQQLVSGFGFDQVAAFVRYGAPTDPHAEHEAVPAGAALRSPSAEELDRLWAFLTASNLVPLNGGLVVEGWTARSLTPSLLEQRLRAGDVCVLEAWEQIQALAIAQARTGGGEPRLRVEYLDGQAEWIGRIALSLRGEAARRGLATVTAPLPDLLMLHDAMDGAGFARLASKALWCYARRL